MEEQVFELVGLYLKALKEDTIPAFLQEKIKSAKTSKGRNIEVNSFNEYVNSQATVLSLLVRLFEEYNKENN
jgi:hypothetical protein